MARAESADRYQNFQFRIVEPEGFLDPVAGFSSATTPELTVGVAEYRETGSLFPIKQPGLATVNSVTLERGLVSAGTDFEEWVRTVVNGGEYRTDLEIWHYHRADGYPDPNARPSRVIRLLNAWPSTVKPDGDLGVEDEAISLQSLTIEFENYEIVQRTPGE